jgi:hypothetical protein
MDTQEVIDICDAALNEDISLKGLTAAILRGAEAALRKRAATAESTADLPTMVRELRLVRSIAWRLANDALTDGSKAAFQTQTALNVLQDTYNLTEINWLAAMRLMTPEQLAQYHRAVAT